MLKDIKKSLKSAYGQTSGRQEARLSNLAKFLYAIIKSGKCSLQSMGNDLPDSTDLESRIKKAKRFLDSKYTDYQTYYLPHITLLFLWLKDRDWVFIIDGSEVGNGCTALMVSIVWRQRALPVCWLVRKCKKGHLPVRAHLEVIKQLAGLLPAGQQNIFLLGDGEFDSPELQQFCQEQKWNYVFRTAKNTIVSPSKNLADGFSMGSLYPMENLQYWLCEQLYFTKKLIGPVNCMVWHERRFEQPIYLVSNLEWAKDIMDYYNQRFLIETMFRDMKSSGFHIHKVRIKDPDRLFNLLIIVAIALLLVTAFGNFKKQWLPFVAQFARKDRLNQLSTFQIGLRAINHCIENRIRLFPQFSKNFFKCFCVRF